MGDYSDVLWQVWAFSSTHFAPIEVLWTTISLGGLWFARRATKRAQRTITRIRSRHLSGPLFQLAQRNARKGFGISGRMFGYFIIGCVALANPPHPIDTGDVDIPGSVITGLVLVIIELWDLVDLVWDEIEWRNLVHNIKVTDRDEVVVAHKIAAAGSLEDEEDDYDGIE